jgi:hypothetical protein
VVDLKFGREKDRREELKQNRMLQLAIYSYLHQCGRQVWPESAYFILTSGRLLAQNDTFFPQAWPHPAVNGPGGTQGCWNDFLQVWRWRKKQLAEGWIENTTAPLLPQAGDFPDATPPVETWLTRQRAERVYGSLTGWEANQ